MTLTIAVGSLFNLKARPQELKAELTPALSKIIEAFMKGAFEERFANPRYFFEVTYLERDGPLELFLRNVFDGLKKIGPTILPLRTGFGFGKTHAEILLLHCFLSAKELPEEARGVLRNVGWDEELAGNTIVLPVDFYEEQHPSTSLKKVLNAYTNRRTRFWRGETVERHIKEMGFDETETSSEFARKVIGLAKACGAPLLLVVDEVGWGFKRRVEDYVQGKGADSLLQIIWLSSFLSNLAGESEREGVPLVVVYAFAEQDERALEYHAGANEEVKRYWSLAKVDLFERLARYMGGISTTALGLDPDDMIKIAMFRTISPLEPSLNKVETARTLSNLAFTLLKLDDKARVEELLKSYYPLSPLMVFALRKLASLEDLPGTEFVRTAIYMLARAAERALGYDPMSPTIDIKHLSLEEACFLGHLGDARADWAGLISELTTAIRGAEEEIRGVCEHAAKVVLSKGSTASTLALLKIEDKRQARKYGTTLEEMQLAALLTTEPGRVGEAPSLMKRAVDYLLSTSSNIEERRIEDVTFLFPAITGTVLSKLQSLAVEERARMTRDSAGYLRASRLLSLITSNLRSEKASIFFANLDQVENPGELVSLVRGALSEPRPAIVFVNVHDETLAQQVREKGYHIVMSDIATKLNEEDFVKVVGMPLYLVLLLPDLSEERLKPLLESLVEYEASERFLEYLKEEEKVVDEFVSRVTTLDVVKRLKLPPSTVQKMITEKVKKDIEVAKDIAERNKLRSAREAAKRLVALYGAIVYDLGIRGFTVIDVTKLFTKATESVEEVRSPVMCTDVLSAFIDGIVEMRFVSSESRLETVVKEFLKHRIEADQLGEVKVDDIAESLFQGSLGVVPINRAIAIAAIERQSGSTFDFPDKTVLVLIDEGYVRFKEKPPIGVKGGPGPGPPGSEPPHVGVKRKLSEFELHGVPEGEILGLRDVLNPLKDEVNTLVVSLKEEDGRPLGTITINRKYVESVGPLTALARTLDAKGDFRIVLKSSKDEEAIADLLGSLKKYWRAGYA